MIHYFSLVRIINSSEVCFYTFALTRFPPLSSHSKIYVRITKADKSSVQIGHAVWVKKNCIPLTDGVQCGNCARHCPTGAIQMVPSIPEDKDSPKIPVINVERCIGCGACENLCPARPFSAIYVEGHERHRII